jgi:asparaginyl-tRNA synthetase
MKRFQPEAHFNNLITDKYYFNLIKLRSELELSCDIFFQQYGAPKVDLFLISRAVTSPMGQGSDSEPVPLNLGSQHAYLSDSSQFGLEPLVLNFFDMAYCYLPSFRGEASDHRHLNQFYHCEAEMHGTMENAIEVAEGLVRVLLRKASTMLQNREIEFEAQNISVIMNDIDKPFGRITFDEACSVLEQSGYERYVDNREYGRVITEKGEITLLELLGQSALPLWVTHHDRDTVPFYQQPDLEQSETTLSADLLVPSISGGFGGELIGLGQRQNSATGIINSLRRQNVQDIVAYDWYVKMRNHQKYRQTSGFGIGIERFVSWILGLENIADAAIYPVRKEDPALY